MENRIKQLLPSLSPPALHYLSALENDWRLHSALTPPQTELFSDFDRKCQIGEFTLIGSCSISPWSIDPPVEHLFSSPLSKPAAAASIFFQAAVISFHLSCLTVHLLNAAKLVC